MSDPCSREPETVPSGTNPVVGTAPAVETTDCGAATAVAAVPVVLQLVHASGRATFRKPRTHVGDAAQALFYHFTFQYRADGRGGVGPAGGRVAGLGSFGSPFGLGGLVFGCALRRRLGCRRRFGGGCLKPRGAASRHVCVFFDFSRGVGRSQSNGLRSGCFTGLPRHGEPPECGSCRALAIGVRRRLPHVSRDAGRGRGITQSNRRGTRRGKGYFSPPNQWLALPKSERTCSSPDKKRI